MLFRSQFLLHVLGGPVGVQDEGAAVLDAVEGDLAADIKALKAEKGNHSVFLLLTDIMKEGSEILIASDDASVVEKAFGVKPVDGKAWLPKVMSRKKDVVPKFEKVFA